jgi:hypothetical protein
MQNTLSRRSSLSRKSDDDDLDQFKSIMVRDDFREDFFEALE